ncbi:hypothetical protein LQE85_08715 [Stenotrophomonas rhizophila]|uniref:hypothetical protein n=1 Tax=Stenotrophomonas rhizophila TaxID=216778 RepID=UPI00201CC88B|nr:hypothetical protein [Stenotrophomonas rhizophila]UQY89263.1 hypothetical protein LQE85_08715 [Stenotrophomonas rhizophila]
MRMSIVAAVVLLTGCGVPPVKTNPPAPVILKVPVATYVPIDAALTKRCSWARAGQPSAVFEVSNGRKRCLDQYEAQFDAIDKVQAKPVPH